MTAAILSLGTEVVRGELVNTNSSWLAERLTERGYIVSEHVSVADDSKHIQETLLRLARQHEVIVCTGGLGPTTDDVTTEAVAELQGVRLVEDPRSLAYISELMRSRGREMAESNKKQAWFPEGASVLENARGTAPGFRTKIADSDAYFLPGVPHEMQAMFERTVAPRLAPRTHQLQIKLNTFGLFESEVNDRLRDIEGRFDVTLGYRAHFPTIEVKVLVSGSDPSSLETRAQDASAAIRERLGADVVFSEGDVTLSQAVGQLLRERSLKLGLAESCTGGLVSELMTDSPGSSQYFSGAVVSYSNEVKQRVLGVPAEMLKAHGAVSEPVARAMAQGARKLLDVDVALSLTGIAGPGGGSADKPVGLVHLAACLGEHVVHKQIQRAGTRARVRRLAAFVGLGMVRRLLLDA